MINVMIDGTLETIAPGRKNRFGTVFKNLVFRLKDGTTQKIPKLVAGPKIAPHLSPGVSGKFYAFKAFDQSAIHGLRLSNGVELQEYPTNNKRLFTISAIGGIALMAVRLAGNGDLPVLGIGLTIIGLAGYFYTSKGETDAKAHFDHDTGSGPE